MNATWDATCLRSRAGCTTVRPGNVGALLVGSYLCWTAAAIFAVMLVFGAVGAIDFALPLETAAMGARSESDDVLFSEGTVHDVLALHREGQDGRIN